MSLRLPAIFMGLYFSKQAYAECLSEKEIKSLKSKQTDVFVWGNGELSDASLKYPNWYPKQIINFSKETQAINLNFGEYFEVYVDKKGKIHVCDNYRLPSKFLEGNEDTKRQIKYVLDIKGDEFIDACFTKSKLIALTQKGDVYIYDLEIEILNKEQLKMFKAPE